MAILYYTHNSLPAAFAARIYWRHRRLAEQHGHQWVAVCREPFAPDDIVQPVEPGPTYADMYRRIMRGLDAVNNPCRMVFLCEHDCLYTPEHWSHVARPGMVEYNLHYAVMFARGYYVMPWGAVALSQLCGAVGDMRNVIGQKLDECLAGRLACVEPAGPDYNPGRNGVMTGTFGTTVPNIDIRTGLNTTWQPPAGIPVVDTLPGWAPWAEMWPHYSEGLANG